MSPPTKEAIPKISPLIIYVSYSTPRLLLLCPQTCILVCLHEFTETQREKTKRVFLYQECRANTQEKNARAQVCQNSMQMGNAVKFQGLGEYSPTQISLAKTGHMVPLNLMRLGNVVFLSIQKGEENQIWVRTSVSNPSP